MTCSRHFDYQVNQFFSYCQKISDWFYRVEYQQRGSPHVHVLIWVDGAPECQVQSDTEVIAFIDKLITCQKQADNQHSHTCRKNTRSECRFNYPQPPMRQTKIPLDTDMPESEMQSHKYTWKSIKQHVDDLKEGQEISFHQLLLDLKITEESYLLAVLSSINAATVFLKRNPSELRINYYNLACLSAWRTNMDIQFILDVYACAVYVANYISTS